MIHRERLGLHKLGGGTSHDRHVVRHMFGLFADTADRLGLSKFSEGDLLCRRGDALYLRAGDGLRSQEEPRDSREALGAWPVQCANAPLDGSDLSGDISVHSEPNSVEMIWHVSLITTGAPLSPGDTSLDGGLPVSLLPPSHQPFPFIATDCIKGYIFIL